MQRPPSIIPPNKVTPGTHIAVDDPKGDDMQYSQNLDSKQTGNEHGQAIGRTLQSSNSQVISSSSPESASVLESQAREGSVDSDLTDDNPQETFECMYTPRDFLLFTTQQHTMLSPGHCQVPDSSTTSALGTSSSGHSMTPHDIQLLFSENRVRPTRDFSEAVPWYRRALVPSPLDQTLSPQLFPSAEQRGWTTATSATPNTTTTTGVCTSASVSSTPERRPQARPQAGRAVSVQISRGRRAQRYRCNGARTGRHRMHGSSGNA